MMVVMVVMNTSNNAHIREEQFWLRAARDGPKR